MSSITTAIINLIVFSLVPVIWWVFRHRKETGFFKWIGFYRPQLKSKWWVLLIFAVLYYFFYNFDFTQLVDPKTLEYIESSSAVSANVFAGIGFTAILPAFIENFVANGVAEEILYRGFLCKRFCNKFGTVQGIILQAVLFGLMHNFSLLENGLTLSPYNFITILIAIGVCALVAFLYYRFFYDSFKKLLHRQKLARMILISQPLHLSESFHKKTPGK